MSGIFCVTKSPPSGERPVVGTHIMIPPCLSTAGRKREFWGDEEVKQRGDCVSGSEARYGLSGGGWPPSS